MTLFDDAAAFAVQSAHEARDYLASDEGRELRRQVAIGMIVAAPVVARLPFMRASVLGRVVGLAGGAALIVKAAEMIRDWEPTPTRVRVDG